MRPFSGRRGGGEGARKRSPRRDPAAMVVLRSSGARRGPPFAIMDSSSEFISLQPTALGSRRTWTRSQSASAAAGPEGTERRGRSAVSSARGAGAGGGAGRAVPCRAVRCPRCRARRCQRCSARCCCDRRCGGSGPGGRCGSSASASLALLLVCPVRALF